MMVLLRFVGTLHSSKLQYIKLHRHNCEEQELYGGASSVLELAAYTILKREANNAMISIKTASTTDLAYRESGSLMSWYVV